MDRDISDILVDIKKKYFSLNVHQCSSYHLRYVANVELQLQERADGTNNPTMSHIRYQNIFNWHDLTKKLSRKVVFVEGEAGMGKTVLSTLIAKDWASGELFQEFIIILLLPLNCRNVATACSLPMLLSELYNLDERKCHILASYLTGPVVKSVLVIADGLDQMGEPGLCEGSFLYHLLFENVLGGPGSCVTVTSRPNHMGAPLTMLQTIDRCVYVKGFSVDTVQRCVKSEFDNAADMAIATYLMHQLDNNLLLQSICSVPLNLAMILKLFPSIPYVCDQPLPDTLTNLYTKLCWAQAESSIRCIEQYKSVKSLLSYNDLPEDLQESWWLLCELAFRNVENGSNSSQVKTTSRSIEVVTFGFLQPISENNEVADFKFLHPAFEQYLAVLHLVKQSRDVQLKFIKTHSNNITLTYSFWQFFFGIYANEVLNSKVKSDDNTVILQATQMLHKAGNNDHVLCRCSFEAKYKLINDEIINTLSSVKEDSLPTTLYFSNARNAHDCIAMIYVIRNVNQQCLVSINFQKCNLRCQHIKELADALCIRASNIQVKELDLSDNVLDDTTVADFFYKAAATLQSLEVLSLHSCGVKNKAVYSIMNVLANFSSQSLGQLDLSYNPLSESCLRSIQKILLRGILVKLEKFSLKGSLPKDISLKLDFLASFVHIVSCRCQNLRQLDLSDNYLGEPDNPIIRRMIVQLTTKKPKLDLRLHDEYMCIVDKNIVRAMESSIRNKGTIDHTVAHGVIVGPGRSGKNTLMSRLTGKGPPDPKDISASTGVAEKIVKVEVRNTCTVAATACNLKWQRLEYDEEALELMMSTAKYHSVSSPVPKSRPYKYIIRNPKQSKDEFEKAVPKINRVQPLAFSEPDHNQVSHDDTSQACQINDSIMEDDNTIYAYSSDVAPVELFKKAIRLRKGDGLREQLESSWFLYLTNTGGQPEFQEYLPFLISGPTIFFITFPLHRDLNEPYTIEYQYPDGRVKSYLSPTTLLEELLQTLATINALRYTVISENGGCVEVRPKVFFIGTHKDCLQDAINNAIHEIDKQIRGCVEQTPLYRMVQFAETSKQMIFTVNNFSESDNDFQKIRTKVQKIVMEKYFEEFTVKCPTSWLVLSLILRERYQSNRVLHIDDCLDIAQKCGISSRKEMKHALSFIHSRLGLIRYYDIEELNMLVVVDPQIIFDKISELIIGTFINEHGEGYEIEDFKNKGIFSEALVKRVSDKCCNSSSSQQLLSFSWLADLLNYLKIAALFKDLDGIKKYFFPSALSHAPAPESSSKLAQTMSPALIAFESGFCPRGISGALIKCLMNNEMKSKQKWRLLIKKIFRNQVSFRIQGCGTITLKILPTHLEICIEDTTDPDLKATCKEAYTQIEKCIEIVTSQCIKCKHFWTFYCTVVGCKTNSHPAEIEWSTSDTAKELWCIISEKSGVLPNRYEIWNIPRKPSRLGTVNKTIDEGGVPKHLGQIAAFMDEWEGPISDNLELTVAEVENIKEEYKSKPLLQKKAALLIWKKKLGESATYSNLISVFEAAGRKDYADNIRRMVDGVYDTNDSRSDNGSLPSQPPPYPDPLDQSLSQAYLPSSPEPSIMYDSIDTDTARMLRIPECDLHECDDPNANLVFVPRLGDQADTSEIPIDLEQVDKKDYKLFEIDSTCELLEFFNTKGMVFRRGHTFYEFQNKTEDIDRNSRIILIYKGTGNYFSGEGARKMVGLLPSSEESEGVIEVENEVKKPDHLLEEYRVFVQDRGPGSRYLPMGSTILIQDEPVSYTPSQSSVCVWHWLSGSCSYGDKCSFRHITPHKSPAVGSILVSEDREVSDEMILKIRPLGRSQDLRSYVVVHEERKIIAEDNSTLQFAQTKILRFLQSVSAEPSHSVTRLNYTYFHPEGVELAQLYEFRHRKKSRFYEVHKVLPKESVKQWNIDEFDHLNREHYARTIATVYSRLKRQKKVEYPILFRKDYKEDIQHRLEDGLRWMYEERLIPKLEGRFGKIVWKENSGDQIMDVDKLANFASTIRSDGLMFFTELDSLSPAALKKTCLSQIGFKDETYLFTIKARQGDESYRIRVKVENGRLKIVYVRQLIGGSIRAQVMFDILCLHRKHDIRLSLQSVDKASTDNPSVERFVLSSIEILESGGVRYNPFATNEKWSVMYVRHQQWESFVFHKHYTVSISAIGCYHINPEKLKPLDIRPEDFSRHHEVELHCSLWEDLDAHSTDDFVNPHADLTPKDSEQWTPKKIVEEFERNGFLQMMDELNKAMELVPVQ